jgi:hypothetical protein
MILSLCAIRYMKSLSRAYIWRSACRAIVALN